MPVAETNGILTHYELEGEGPPVILIHGHASDRRLWERHAAFLAQNRFRAVRYDLRGHGCSDAPASGYTLDNYVRDLADLLDRVSIDRAHLVGLSMGGGIALAFALDHPDRVRSVALIDTALPGFAYSPDYEAAIERLRDAVRTEDVRAALEKHWLTHPLFDGIRRNPEQFDLLRQMVFTYTGADYLDETDYPPLARPPIDRLADMTVPVLVMVGELDLPDFRLIADILVDNIPGAESVVVPNAGHVLPLERPEAVSDALLAFLTRV